MCSSGFLAIWRIHIEKGQNRKWRYKNFPNVWFTHRCNFGTIDDYHLMENLNYRIQERAEEKFRPLGLGGVVYRDLVTGWLNAKHEDYFRLLTGYGIAQYIREQLRCQPCFDDLTIRKEGACKKVDDNIVSKNKQDNDILTYEYLEAVSPERSTCSIPQRFWHLIRHYETAYAGSENKESNTGDHCGTGWLFPDKRILQ